MSKNFVEVNGRFYCQHCHWYTQLPNKMAAHQRKKHCLVAGEDQIVPEETVLDLDETTSKEPADDAGDTKESD